MWVLSWIFSNGNNPGIDEASLPSLYSRWWRINMLMITQTFSPRKRPHPRDLRLNNRSHITRENRFPSPARRISVTSGLEREGESRQFRFHRTIYEILRLIITLNPWLVLSTHWRIHLWIKLKSNYINLSQFRFGRHRSEKSNGILTIFSFLVRILPSVDSLMKR